jgi:glycosyltransferase involved in cell wall biosynthesis
MAIAHEWVDSYAGSEQVFEALARLFPDADLFALSVSPNVELATNGRPIRTTILDKSLLRNRRAWTLPLMPFAWRALGSDSYDLVISSHHAFAHSNRLAGRNGVHLSYVHTPARYLWSPEVDHRGASKLLSPARAALRRVDRASAERVDGYAANSNAVASRIAQFWRRPATVIHPPVRVAFFHEPSAAAPTADYILGVGRWVPYKNLHRVIEAASLARMPVKIAGRGPDKSRILAAADAATVDVELIESPTDIELRALYHNAACLIFPTVEDFGIIPVEAQAAGTPVIAVAEGGALDTVIPGTTGVLVSDIDARTLADAVEETIALPRSHIAKTTDRFSVGEFDRAIRSWIMDGLGLYGQAAGAASNKRG